MHWCHGPPQTLGERTKNTVGELTACQEIPEWGLFHRVDHQLLVDISFVQDSAIMIRGHGGQNPTRDASRFRSHLRGRDSTATRAHGGHGEPREVGRRVPMASPGAKACKWRPLSGRNSVDTRNPLDRGERRSQLVARHTEQHYVLRICIFGSSRSEKAL